MHATNSSGGALSYSASGLPAGLSINDSTGLISGAPTAAGSSLVTVGATDAGVGSATASFTWTVNPVTVAITSPGKQSGTVGRPVSLQITAADNNGGRLSYAARALPRGLSINSSSGLVSGRPTAAGSSTVTVTATTPGGGPATTSFTWQIGGAASVSQESISGVANRRPKLSLTVAAAAGSPPIKVIVIGLPKGLSFSTNAKRLFTHIVVRGPGGRRLTFTARVRHGAMTITLGTVAPRAQIAISGTALTATKSLAHQAAHTLTWLSLVVKTINSSHAMTRFALKLGA